MAPLPSCSGTRMSESLCRCTFYLRLKLMATKLHHLRQITKFIFGRLRIVFSAAKSIINIFILVMILTILFLPYMNLLYLYSIQDSPFTLLMDLSNPSTKMSYDHLSIDTFDFASSFTKSLSSTKTSWSGWNRSAKLQFTWNS